MFIPVWWWLPNSTELVLPLAWVDVDVDVAVAIENPPSTHLVNQVSVYNSTLR